MRFAKILTVAAMPMFLFACGDNDSADFSNNAKTEDPVQQPKDSIPENTPDSILTPITRDYSSIWQGEGTAEKPYLISNEDELSKLAFYVSDSAMTFRDKFFKQTADIALSKAWNPIGVFGKNAYGYGNRPFGGTYDGDSKSISGLTINDTASYSGLFGLTRGASVKNVVIKNAKLNVGSYAGVLAGKMDSTSVENCKFESVEIKGTDRVGALVGEATHVQATNVSVTGTVQGTNSVGGLVGRLQDGSLSNVTNNASVTGASTVGGIVGSFASVASEGLISGALNNGSVSGTKDVGGVVATISSTKIERSGNAGEVNAEESQMSNVGGVVAVASSKSSVNEVFNTGKVTVKKVQSVGGVIGSMKAITATNLFNQGEISGKASNMGGLVGVVDNDSKLEFGYNSGKIPDENFAGAVAGKASMTAVFTNVYYDKTVAGTCLDVANHMLDQDKLPKGASSEELKASTFIATLNGAGNVWTVDSTKFGGYPVFTWLQ